MSPLTVCIQQFDINITANTKRGMRIFDWIAKLNKTSPFKKYNEKYTGWFMSYFASVFVPLYLIFGYVMVSIVIWFTITNWNDISQNALFLPMIFTIASLGIITSFLSYRFYAKVIGIKSSIVLPFFALIYAFQALPHIIKHWFLAYIKSKYSTFNATSSPKRNFGNNSFIEKIKSIYSSLIGLIISAIFLALFNFEFYQFNLIHSNLLIFIFIDMLLAILFLAFFSEIFLFLLSFISDKKYNPKNYIYVKNDTIKFKKIKDKFYASHRHFTRIC
jgi:hypothetical protein